MRGAAVFLADHEAGADGVEGEAGFVSLDGHGTEDGAAGDQIALAVLVFEGEEGEALADVELVLRVDVGGFAEVDGDGEVRVGNGQAAGLGFAHDGPGIAAGGGFVGGAIAGELDDVEGELRVGEEGRQERISAPIISV